MKKIVLLCFLTPFFFFACKDSGTDPQPPVTALKGAYIICEGSFGQNNASITYYNEETGETVIDAYERANAGSSLGDNGNSMTIYGTKGYIAVNGSNKIETVNLETFTSEGFVNLGQSGSPREVWLKDSLNGYVTSFSGNVIKFNPASKSIIKSIPVGEKPEGLASASGKLFVANSWFGDLNNISNTVSVIDLGSDAEVTRIRVGLNPTKVFTGPDNKIYVISTGSYVDPSVFSGIYVIDPATNQLLDSIKVEGNPFEACFINSSRMLVVNASGVMDVNMSTKSVSSAPLIPTDKVTTFQFGQIYSLAYDENRQEILCGNPKDFQQNGEVVIFSTDGSEKKRINTGINPGTIVLK